MFGLYLIVWTLFGHCIQWFTTDRHNPIDGGEWDHGFAATIIRAASWPIGVWMYRHKIWKATKNCEVL